MEAPGQREQQVLDDPGVDEEDRWAWRARIKRNRATRRLYRAAVGVVGLLLLVVGIIAIPLPGPGWALVFVALAVLASEFEPADRLLQFARRHVRRWTAWVGDQPLYVRGLVGLGTLALVLGLFWAYFAVSGVPGWLPTVARDLLLRVPGL